MTIVSVSHSGTLVGDSIAPSELGGEYLGWTGLPGWTAQASHLGITHIRWPAGINAEDRMEGDVYAFDLATPTLVDNWPLWNGNPRPGLPEMFETANQFGASFAMIVPTARYVEMMRTDPLAATAWIEADIASFTTRLFNGAFGTVPPDFLLEIGAEYYSTDAWAAFADDPDIEDDFAAVFAAIVSALEAAETAHGSDVYKIAVQAARFQSNDDAASDQDGELLDAQAFLSAYAEAGLEDSIDALIWHRYLYTFNQTAHHLTPNAGEHTLEEHVALWETTLGKPLDLVLGWAAPDVDRNDESATDPFFDFGPRAAHTMLQMFSELAEAGMDYATIYGIDSPWTGYLTQGTTSASDFVVSFHGEVYRLLAESVAGLQATDAFHGNVVFTDAANGIVPADHANVFGFSDGAGRDVVFVANWDLVSDTVTLDISVPEGSESLYVAIESIRPEGQTGLPEAATHLIGPTVTADGRLLIHDTTDFMVTRAEFIDDPETNRVTTPFQTLTSLNSGRSTLSLSNDADSHMLNGPDVFLLGLDGNDSLEASVSEAFLAGGSGSDLLIGGAGGDVIYGDDVDLSVLISWLSEIEDVFDF